MRETGLEDPVHCFKDWTMAPSGMTFVDDPESRWHGDLFIAGLRGKHIERFEFENGSITGHGIFFVNRAGDSSGLSRRLREVEYHDGALWIIGDQKGLVQLTSE